MNRKTFLLIVIITALSLVGIIVIQVFWIKNAVQLQENIFDNKVRVALKSVVNGLFETKLDTAAVMPFCEKGCGMGDARFPARINTTLLDSLIRSEFAAMQIDKDYEYGIYNPEKRMFYAGRSDQYRNELYDSRHCVSLSCLYRSDSYMLGAYFPNERSMLYMRILKWMVMSILFLGVLVFGFTYTILSFLKQKKLSEMKTDFVNNMTHEFKTPIATISLASEMLMKPQVSGAEDKIRKYASIIYDENLRLKNQVEQVLRIAVLDKGEITLKLQKVDLHEIIAQSIRNSSLAIRERNGNIKMNLLASKSKVIGDQMHIENILTNLLDNANKYSPNSPEINISTSNSDKGVFVVVADKGIGISSENHKHVFKKLFRVHTGNVHDVKGFGLGLFYVKTMVEAHGGFIRLNSEVGQGSSFEFFLPFNNTNQQIHAGDES
jgi:two-component system, OmpR family, phosphate regulon sensor histidine kinase PhoR